MREILFRGKRLDNSKWVYGYYAFHTNGLEDEDYKEYHIIQPLKENGRFDVLCDVEPKKVGQFIGCTDKNGTKIFEGDIVKDKYILGKVVYNTKQEDFDGAASFMIDDVDDGLQSYRFWNSVEVIGNIHDNPELIGGADNE